MAKLYKTTPGNDQESNRSAGTEQIPYILLQIILPYWAMCSCLGGGCVISLGNVEVTLLLVVYIWPERRFGYHFAYILSSHVHNLINTTVH